GAVLGSARLHQCGRERWAFRFGLSAAILSASRAALLSRFDGIPCGGRELALLPHGRRAEDRAFRTGGGILSLRARQNHRRSEQGGSSGALRGPRFATRHSRTFAWGA